MRFEPAIAETDIIRTLPRLPGQTEGTAPRELWVSLSANPEGSHQSRPAQPFPPHIGCGRKDEIDSFMFFQMRRDGRQSMAAATLALRRAAVRNTEETSLPDLFQAQLAVVLLGNSVALTGRVLKFIAVHDLHCATSVLDELLSLQNTSCQAHAGSICP